MNTIIKTRIIFQQKKTNMNEQKKNKHKIIK